MGRSAGQEAQSFPSLFSPTLWVRKCREWPRGTLVMSANSARNERSMYEGLKGGVEWLSRAAFDIVVGFLALGGIFMPGQATDHYYNKRRVGFVYSVG